MNLDVVTGWVALIASIAAILLNLRQFPISAAKSSAETVTDISESAGKWIDRLEKRVAILERKVERLENYAQTLRKQLEEHDIEPQPYPNGIKE
jgi:TolA-binding protein